MMRRGLVLVLTFLVAGGPWLCCCTATRLFAAVAPPKAIAPACSCCCKPTVPGSCCSEEPKAPEPVKPADDCPCRNQTAPCCGFVATPAKSASFDASFAIAAVACDIVPFAPPAQAVVGVPLRELPFLTVSDLLHAQHRLRC